MPQNEINCIYGNCWVDHGDKISNKSIKTIGDFNCCEDFCPTTLDIYDKIQEILQLKDKTSKNKINIQHVLSGENYCYLLLSSSIENKTRCISIGKDIGFGNYYLSSDGNIILESSPESILNFLMWTNELRKVKYGIFGENYITFGNEEKEQFILTYPSSISIINSFPKNESFLKKDQKIKQTKREKVNGDNIIYPSTTFKEIKINRTIKSHSTNMPMEQQDGTYQYNNASVVILVNDMFGYKIKKDQFENKSIMNGTDVFLNNKTAFSENIFDDPIVSKEIKAKINRNINFKPPVETQLFADAGSSGFSTGTIIMEEVKWKGGKSPFGNAEGILATKKSNLKQTRFTYEKENQLIIKPFFRPMNIANDSMLHLPRNIIDESDSNSNWETVNQKEFDEKKYYDHEKDNIFSAWIDKTRISPIENPETHELIFGFQDRKDFISAFSGKIIEKNGKIQVGNDTRSIRAIKNICQENEIDFLIEKESGEQSKVLFKYKEDFDKVREFCLPEEIFPVFEYKNTQVIVPHKKQPNLIQWAYVHQTFFYNGEYSSVIFKDNTDKNKFIEEMENYKGYFFDEKNGKFYYSESDEEKVLGILMSKSIYKNNIKINKSTKEIVFKQTIGVDEKTSFLKEIEKTCSDKNVFFTNNRYANIQISKNDKTDASFEKTLEKIHEWTHSKCYKYIIKNKGNKIEPFRNVVKKINAAAKQERQLKIKEKVSEINSRGFAFGEASMFGGRTPSIADVERSLDEISKTEEPILPKNIKPPYSCLPGSVSENKPAQKYEEIKFFEKKRYSKIVMLLDCFCQSKKSISEEYLLINLKNFLNLSEEIDFSIQENEIIIKNNNPEDIEKIISLYKIKYFYNKISEEKLTIKNKKTKDENLIKIIGSTSEGFLPENINLSKNMAEIYFLISISEIINIPDKYLIIQIDQDKITNIEKEGSLANILKKNLKNTLIDPNKIIKTSGKKYASLQDIEIFKKIDSLKNKTQPQILSKPDKSKQKESLDIKYILGITKGEYISISFKSEAEMTTRAGEIFDFFKQNTRYAYAYRYIIKSSNTAEIYIVDKYYRSCLQRAIKEIRPKIQSDQQDDSKNKTISYNKTANSTLKNLFNYKNIIDASDLIAARRINEIKTNQKIIEGESNQIKSIFANLQSTGAILEIEKINEEKSSIVLKKTISQQVNEIAEKIDEISELIKGKESCKYSQETISPYTINSRYKVSPLLIKEKKYKEMLLDTIGVSEQDYFFENEFLYPTGGGEIFNKYIREHEECPIQLDGRSIKINTKNKNAINKFYSFLNFANCPPIEFVVMAKNNMVQFKSEKEKSKIIKSFFENVVGKEINSQGYDMNIFLLYDNESLFNSIPEKNTGSLYYLKENNIYIHSEIFGLLLDFETIKFDKEYCFKNDSIILSSDRPWNYTKEILNFFYNGTCAFNDKIDEDKEISEIMVVGNNTENSFFNITDTGRCIGIGDNYGGSISFSEQFDNIKNVKSDKKNTFVLLRNGEVIEYKTNKIPEEINGSIFDIDVYKNKICLSLNYGISYENCSSISGKPYVLKFNEEAPFIATPPPKNINVRNVLAGEKHATAIADICIPNNFSPSGKNYIFPLGFGPNELKNPSLAIIALKERQKSFTQYKNVSLAWGENCFGECELYIPETKFARPGFSFSIVLHQKNIKKFTKKTIIDFLDRNQFHLINREHAGAITLPEYKEMQCTYSGSPHYKIKEFIERLLPSLNKVIFIGCCQNSIIYGNDKKNIGIITPVHHVVDTLNEFNFEEIPLKFSQNIILLNNVKRQFIPIYAGRYFVPERKDYVQISFSEDTSGIGLTSDGKLSIIEEFNWDQKNYHPCSRIPDELKNLKEDESPEILSCGNKHAIVKINDKKWYAWGSNYNNEVKIPHCKYRYMHAGNHISVLVEEKNNLIILGKKENLFNKKIFKGDYSIVNNFIGFDNFRINEYIG